MAVDFIKMMQQEQKEKKEDKQPQKKENVAEAKPVAQNQDKIADVKDEKSSEPIAKKLMGANMGSDTYLYPFSLYTEGHIVDISNYGFEDGQRYSEAQISKVMLEHRHYEFAGEMTYKMFEDDNVLVATAKQYKKG